jgi:localization factor PodJL
MSAGAPWSVKGIDPKAREIAKDLARRSGMTLGEWLNTMIIEGEAEEDSVVTPFARRASVAYAGHDRRGRSRRLDDAYAGPERELEDGEFAAVTRALEALTARIEAAENRSTLAVSGVNQAVAGLLARLETAERDQSATSARLEHVAEDFRDEHGRMLERLREIEHEAIGPRSVEALRALETAMGKIANQIYEGDVRTRATLGELRDDLATVARRVDRVETRPAADTAMVEGVVSRIAERLERAESRTSDAIRVLETSFASLDERLRGAESRLQADPETRLERLAEELSERVERSRAELIQSIDAAADGRFGPVDQALAELSDQVQAAERRSAEAVERMGHEVLRIAHNLNRRMTGVEQAGAEAVERVGARMDRMAETVEHRLRAAEGGQAAALERLGAEISKISARLSERVAAAERRQATAADDLGERVGRVADKLEARIDRTAGEFADRIRQSEERTARLLEEARETIDRSLARVESRAARADAAPEAHAFAADAEGLGWADDAPAFPHQAAAEPDPLFDTPEPAFPSFADAAAEFEPEPGPIRSAEPEPVADPFDTAFEGFTGESEFVEPAQPRPPVSTREAIEAARAAARLGVRNGQPEGPSFGLKLSSKSRLQERVEQESKRREGSTVKTALLASVTAAFTVGALTSGVLGYRQIFAEPDAPARKPGSGDDAKLVAREPTQPLAAVALSPSFKPAAPADADAAADLYRQAVDRLSRNDAGGVTTLTRAANLGYAPAQYHLAKLYEEGQAGLKADLVEARRWGERAAEGGDPRAMFNLGMYFYEGVGGPQDAAQAAAWFRKAADRDLVDSQYNLGRLYELGLGVPQDLGEAYKWYLVASRHEDAGARAAADRLKVQLTAVRRAAAESAAAMFRATGTEQTSLAAR